MIEDELTFASFEAQNEEQQQKIISEYCANIEERIQKAETKQHAQEIVEKSCDEFNRTCSSELLKRSLIYYVKGLLEKYWSKQ